MKRLMSLAVAAFVALFADAQAAQPARPAKAVGYGSNGKEVVWAQEALSKLGYLQLKGNRPTGYFRNHTKRAVLAFQKDYGLAQTGAWSALDQETAQRVGALMAKYEKRRSQQSDFFACLRNFFGGSDAPAMAPVAARQQQTVTRTVTASLPRNAKFTMASVFGFVGDKLDNGRGSPYLSNDISHGINTRIAVGVALPTREICRTFNVPPPPKRSSFPYTKEGKRQWWMACKATHEAWQIVRDSRVDLFCPTTGRCLTQTPVPIVDLGPGEGPLAAGVGIDLTSRLNRSINGDGKTPVAYKINVAKQPKPKEHSLNYAAL
jgi:peptidoglycan hydrolase-like protein with peptidoglycan-binding domain